jgi:methionyl-tRNA formyltransferase
MARGLPVSDRAADVVDTEAELGVVVAFGQLIRPDVLAQVPMVNVHFSLLPRWRGAAPVERAILAGDQTTGVCLMALEAGLDTGPVYRRATVDISAEDTAVGLRSRLAELGATQLVTALADGLGDPIPQVGEVTYAQKLTSADRHLAWDRSAEELSRVVRIGRAWTTWRGRRLLILDAAVTALPHGLAAEPGTLAHGLAGEPGTLIPGSAHAVGPAVSSAAPGPEARSPGQDPVVVTGNGGLVLRTVQPEGRAATSGQAWARGARFERDERLGEPS